MLVCFFTVKNEIEHLPEAKVISRINTNYFFQKELLLQYMLIKNMNPLYYTGFKVN